MRVPPSACPTIRLLCSWPRLGELETFPEPTNVVYASPAFIISFSMLYPVSYYHSRYDETIDITVWPGHGRPSAIIDVDLLLERVFMIRQT
jgi:hypothetical protein